MIALPYNDSETFMYALKPLSHKRLTLLELMENINNKVIDDTINEMHVKNCVIRFPKMKIKSTTKLESTLQSIGIQSMFIPGQANFALMVNNTNQFVNKSEGESDRYSENEGNGTNILDSLPNPGIHVDSIIHDVKLTINGKFLNSLGVFTSPHVYYILFIRFRYFYNLTILLLNFILEKNAMSKLIQLYYWYCDTHCKCGYALCMSK